MLKYLLLLFLIVSCGDQTTLEEAESNISSCNGVTKELRTVVDGCKVYHVESDYWYQYKRWGDSNSHCCKKCLSFLYTSCPKDNVKWGCGKNCEKTNLTN